MKHPPQKAHSVPRIHNPTPTPPMAPGRPLVVEVKAEQRWRSMATGDVTDWPLCPAFLLPLGGSHAAGVLCQEL